MGPGDYYGDIVWCDCCVDAQLGSAMIKACNFQGQWRNCSGIISLFPVQWSFRLREDEGKAITVEESIAYLKTECRGLKWTCHANEGRQYQPRGRWRNDETDGDDGQDRRSFNSGEEDIALDISLNEFVCGVEVASLLIPDGFGVRRRLGLQSSCDTKPGRRP